LFNRIWRKIRKLPIYRALRVPEVWIYNGNVLAIYRLGDQGYTSVERSEEAPFLTSQLLTNFFKGAEETDDDNQLLQDYVEIILQAQPQAI
jgi:Uma2 family endonuclease